MGVIDDVRKWLEEIPLWREVEKIPARTDELEKRASALGKAFERVLEKPAQNAVRERCDLVSRVAG